MIPQCGHEDCKRSSYAGCLHDTSALNTALMVAELNKRTLKAERELDEINGKILVTIAQALNEAAKLQKRNEYLEHELIALGHINCEWCRYWKQDQDSSDEGVCELAGKSPWGMFRIDHREYGQAMAGHVLKTLCNFGCKEGKAKPCDDQDLPTGENELRQPK